MSSRGRSTTPTEGNHVATRHARWRRDNFARHIQCDLEAPHKKTWKALRCVSTCPLATHADSAELMALGAYFSSSKSTVEPTTTRVLLVRNAMSSVSTVSAVPLRQW